MHKQHGFKSENTLNKCKKELLDANLIYLTRQGDKRRCSLFALTWIPIDECEGKLDCKSTKIPIRKEWHSVKLTTPKKKRMTKETIIYFEERKERKQCEN